LSTPTIKAANAQQNYDGRDGPHQFGQPGNGIYIRGQNEGPYQVPGVGGTFQNSPASGGHVYTDEQGNTYRHHAATVSLAPSTVNLSLGGVLLVIMSLIAL
ncbi:hypothetical protein KR032_007226, partial [Drosophila birchii]